jgi:hypothetical protein
VVAVDLDGDGKLDLASGSFDATVLLNQGNGAFATGMDYDVGAGNNITNSYLTTADLNGDGKPDLAFTNNRGLAVLFNQGNGTFAPAANYSVGSFPFTVAAVDMNGDGRLDLVSGSAFRSKVSVLLGACHP